MISPVMMAPATNVRLCRARRQNPRGRGTLMTTGSAARDDQAEALIAT
jgi:hypothetical protein